MILQGCTTKTLTKIESVQIPKQYLTECHAEDFEPDLTIILKQAKNLKKCEWKLFVSKAFNKLQAEYAVELQSIIDGCNANINDIIKYQKRLNVKK